MTEDRYYDLTDATNDITGLRIQPNNRFSCDLIDSDGVCYRGFKLATSATGSALTVCDVDFQISDTDHKYQPRLIFRRTNAEFADKTVNAGKTAQRISFQNGSDGYRHFWKMIMFLQGFKEIVDFGDFQDTYQVVTDESVVVHLKTKLPAERKKNIAKIVTELGISDSEMADLLSHRARIDDVDSFRKLLDNENGYRADYRTEYATEIKGSGDEAVWHHFLKNHKWIFGLSLDLRFIDDVLDEQAVGIPGTDGKGDPHVDMLGYNDFTVLIELKTSDAKIFTETKTAKARTNTWSFTDDFIEGFSQCLAQKSDWETVSQTKKLVKGEGANREEIDRGIIRTIDPQVIFIYGNKTVELPINSAKTDIRIKRDTLERFIRNNRNVNIISFDELYKRAYHIAYGEPLASPDLPEDEPVDAADTPF